LPYGRESQGGQCRPQAPTSRGNAGSVCAPVPAGTIAPLFAAVAASLLFHRRRHGAGIIARIAKHAAY